MALHESPPELSKPLPARGFLILLLGTLSAVGPLSIDMYLPSFPELATVFDVSISRVELSLSSFFIGLAIGQLFFGPLADAFGRKKPLLIGITIYFLSSLFCVFAPNVESLIALRFLQALGGCAGMVISRAVVRDLFDHREAAKIYSLLMLVMGVAPILAPAAGAYVAAAVGWKGIFAVLAAISFLTWIAIAMFLPETKAKEDRSPLSISRSIKNYFELLLDSSFVRYALPNSLTSAGMFAYIAGSPYVFIELYDLSPTAYGWLFGFNAVGIIGASQVNRFLLRTFAPEKIVAVALSISLTAALSLYAVSNWTSPSLSFLMAPLFIVISSQGFVGPNCAALALAKQGHRAGVASALFGSLQFSIAFLSSFVVSSLHAESSRPMTGTIALCIVSAFLLFFGLGVSAWKKSA